MHNRYYEKIGKNEPKCIDDEIPFDIPDSWCWVRLGHLININGGFAFKSKDYVTKEQGVRVLRISDFSESGFNQKRPVYHKISPKLEEFKLDVNDIIMCMTGGTVGKSYYIEVLPEPMLVNQRVADIKINTIINKKYVYSFILSPYIQNIINDSKNSTNDNISILLINSFLTPLPPLAEQERIVNRVEELLSQVDIIDKNQNDIEVLYEDLKKRTLDLAIQGKLVPQDVNDEPASVLLEKIRAEKKAQLGKKYIDSYIYKGDDNCYYEHIDGIPKDNILETPFQLPKSWAWSRIQSISESYIGLTYNPSNIISSGGNIVLRSSNIKDGKLDLTDIVRVNVDIPEKLVIKKNDIIICARNGSKKLVGKSAIVDIERQDLTFGAFMAICRTQLFPYVYAFLQSKLFFSQLAQVSGTTTINQLTQGNFNRFLIPIPPFAEQKRIVDRINEIFAIM